MKINTNYIFALGSRCYSTDFLIKYNLRRFSGPFDYLFIDFETSLTIINNNFGDFLTDIVLFNKNENKTSLFYANNTNKVENKLEELLKENLIGYMRFNYNPKTLFINQNYLREEKLCGNLYHWDKICIFKHHDVTDPSIYSKLKERCERFKNIINNHSSKTILFYITKIKTIKNITSYLNWILSLKEKYNIHSYIVIIICSDNMEDGHYFIYNCLFIVKKVEPYLDQFEKYEYDSDLKDINYDNEINIIREYFDFDLTEKSNC
jgi:hypothetical protein